MSGKHNYGIHIEMLKRAIPDLPEDAMLVCAGFIPQEQCVVLTVASNEYPGIRPYEGLIECTPVRRLNAADLP